MNSKKEIVETEVDNLLVLLKKEGKISFEKAARELNVPFSTVEEWADFLEEDGIITIKYSFTTPFMEINEHEEKKIDLEEEEKPKTPEKKIEAENFPQKKTGTVDELITEAEAAIKAGDFKKARFVYNQVKARAKDLPFKFIEKSKDIETKLISLSEDISEQLDKFSIQAADRKINEIKSLIKDCRKKTSSSEALAIYNKIKSIFSKLPKGFFEEKTLLEEEILSLYKELLVGKKEAIEKEFAIKSKEISAGISQINTLLSLGNVNAAFEAYEKIEKDIDTLPEDFMQQKILFRQRLADVYKDILSQQSKESYKALSFKRIEVTELLSKLKWFIEANDITQAEIIYDQIRKIYSELPKGFIEEEIELEKSILAQYDQLMALKKKCLFQDERKKIDKINYLLKVAEKNIKLKKIEAAHFIYNEIALVYNSLSEGFSKKKLILRKDILNLYGVIVANIDAIHLEKLDKESKADYNELIKLLVRSYMDIDNGDFLKLKDNYTYIYDLYNKLPVGFVKGNIKLKDEILKFNRLARLFETANKLYELNYTNQGEGINNALKYIIDEYLVLLDKAPEAQRLLDYVKNKYAQFQDKLILGEKISPEIEKFESEVQATEQKLSKAKCLLEKAAGMRIQVEEAERLKKEVQEKIQRLSNKQIANQNEKTEILDQLRKEKELLRSYEQPKFIFRKEPTVKPVFHVARSFTPPVKYEGESEETKQFREKLLKRKAELEQKPAIHVGESLAEHYLKEEKEKLLELKALVEKKKKSIQEKRELLLKRNQMRKRIEELKETAGREEIARRRFTHKREFTSEKGKSIDELYREGVDCLEKGDYSKAIISFESILGIKPDHLNAMIKLSEAEERKKGEEKNSVRDTLVRLKLKKIRSEIGSKDKMILIDEINEVLMLDPDNKGARELYKQLVIG